MNAASAGSARATRELLLNAAGSIVLEAGVAALTLDAVARRAQVSKGGLLYHFKSKEALIAGMLNRLIEAFEDRLAAHLAAQGGEQEPGAWLRAYVAANFSSTPTGPSVSTGLLAAVATSPELQRQLRQQFDAWHQRTLADRLDPALATVVRLAADGLFMSEALQLAPLDEPLRGQVARTLAALVLKAQQL